MGRRIKVDFDSLEYRKYLWDKEYSTRKALPSTNSFHPSTSLRNFINNHKDVNKGFAYDIGCGNGRNSIFLAQSGFKHIDGSDISQKGIDIAKEELDKTSYKQIISYSQGDSAQLLSKSSYKYDLIIDMCVLHSLTKESREILIAAIKQKLNINGYFLLFTLMATSPAVINLKKNYPGPENNSYRFEYEEDTITEVAFDKEDLVNMFEPLKLIEYEEYQTVTRAYKGEYPRIYVTCLFQNI